MKRISSVIVGIFIVASLSVQAENDSWKSGIYDGNWHTGDNWSLGHPPLTTDTATFTVWKGSAPFTVSFTNDVTTRLLLGYHGNLAGLNTVTFDLNGHTFSHVNSTLDAYSYLDWTIIDGTMDMSAGGYFMQGWYEKADWITRITVGTNAVFKYSQSGTTYMRIGEKSGSDFVVKDGGLLITDLPNNQYAVRVGNSTTAGFTNYTATMTVTGEGSCWSNLAGLVYFGNHALATAKLVVANNGRMIYNGNEFAFGTVSGSHGMVEVSSGGLLDMRGQTAGNLAVGKVTGSTGTISVADSGSEIYYRYDHLYLGNGGSGTLLIDNGGLFAKDGANKNLYVGYNAGQGDIQVSGGGTLRWAGGSGGVVVGGYSDARRGAMTVTGTNSSAIVGEFIVADTRGTGTVTVADGATLESYRTMYLGRKSTSVSSYNGQAKMVITGEGAMVKHSTLTIDDLPDATISTTSSLGVGGGGFSGWNADGLNYYAGYGPGGKGKLIVEHGGLVDINGSVNIYSNSTIRIDGGRTKSSLIGMETGVVFNAVLRNGDANGSALMTATGEVRLWGPTLNLELGSDFVRVPKDVYTLISGSTIASPYNRLSYDGATLQEGAIITVEGSHFKVNYSATDITLTVMPPQGIIILIR